MSFQGFGVVLAEQRVASDKGMNLTPIVTVPDTFTLLMAPPAWGKTWLLLQHIERGNGVWIFLSPLRALANEFYDNCGNISARYLIKCRADWKEVKGGKNALPTLIVTTPECLRVDGIENLARGRQVSIIVDEFHLFYLWGHSFRPTMWDSLLALSCRGFSFVALSATMNETLLRQWRRDFSLACDILVEIDVGNRRFKYFPQRIYYFSPWGKRMLERRFLFLLLARQRIGKGKTMLYFCRYRRQVDSWVSFCRRRGILAVGCKGGEVEFFIEEMAALSHTPVVIFSTTALSHGVNLPQIDKVFLSYVVESEDFWLQMATRGGRNGENFQIYTLNTYKKSLQKCCYSLLLNSVWDVFVRMYLMVRML